ncbi:MAG: peptidoglycan DD-metalloendopeptidase family protein [Hyphomonadaceae bacterium]|nr:peptidoglycan DD-metalloendopeptidase family protein [Hyphomonadaceae bacterium]
MTRALFVLALLAGGCATSSPAPISYGGGAQPARQPAAAAPIQRVEPPPQARPRAPEPAPDWADGEGTPLSAYALRPEDAQPFDPAALPRTHRVRAGESLYEIATLYQVPLRALIDQNRLEPPYALPPGRELELPPPRFHVVARGERFEEIAQRYSIDARSLALLNRMQAPYLVREGERIVLPAMAREAPSAPPAATPAPQQVAAAPVISSARFAWPLRGEVVGRFGPQADRQRLDGIEIAGLEGAQVQAAADGEIVYAGDDLPGYGFLVLVSHADNYVTAYGYNRRALVREGQRVRAGQAIAELGPRPDGRPRLLFQVRRGAEPLDPASVLAPR